MEDEEDADPLVAKATQLERQSAELSAKLKVGVFLIIKHFKIQAIHLFLHYIYLYINRLSFISVYTVKFVYKDHSRET